MVCSKFLVFLFVLSLVLGACSQRLIKKERLKEINDLYDSQVYSLRQDLKLSAETTWKKGSMVKLYVESTPSLLKLKVYPITESRESSTGKLAAYIINDDVKKRSFEKEDLDVWIAEKFQLVTQPVKKGKM